MKSKDTAMRDRRTYDYFHISDVTEHKDNVQQTIDAYEVNGDDLPGLEYKIGVNSHWSDSDWIVLQVGGNLYTVDGQSLIKAVKNALNTQDTKLPLSIALEDIEDMSHFGVIRDWEIILKNGRKIELCADVVREIVAHENKELAG